MTGFIFAINDVLRRSRLIWIGPVILFFITSGVRLTPLFTKETQIVYLINICGAVLGVLISSVIMINLIRYLMPSCDDIKYEVMFYKKLGLDVLTQFSMKMSIITLSLLLLFTINSVLIWSVNFKYLLLGLAFSLFFLFLRVLGLVINTSVVYYVGVVLIIISLFYPLYVLPNVAYIFKSGSPRIYLYLFTYVVLYFVSAFKLFSIAWREECIGWIF